MQRGQVAPLHRFHLGPKATLHQFQLQNDCHLPAINSADRRLRSDSAIMTGLHTQALQHTAQAGPAAHSRFPQRVQRSPCLHRLATLVLAIPNTV